MEMLASLQKIRRKRKERIEGVNAFKKEIDKIKGNAMYSQEYKDEYEKEIREGLNGLRTDLDAAISEEIETNMTKLQEKLSHAQYEGLNGDAATRALLQEMRNQQIYESLIAEYEGKTSSGLGSQLHKKTMDQVKANTVEAPAYLRAAKKFGLWEAHELEEEYKAKNLNKLEKEIHTDMKLFEEEQAAWREEQNQDVSSFKAALLNNYTEEPAQEG